MKTLTRLIAIALTATLAAALLGCVSAGSLPEIEINPIDVERVTIGASPLGSISSLGDNGLLYISMRTMRYLDFQTNRYYVLCPRPNCRHDNDGCFAWVGRPNWAYGLAQYGSHIYVLKYNEGHNTYDMTRMSLDASAQVVICSLDVGDGSPGSWYLTSINNVVYAGGFAWLEVGYQYLGEYEGYESGAYYLPGTYHGPVMATSIIGIDLASGEVTALYQPSLVDAENDEEYGKEYGIEVAAKGCLVIEETWDDEPLLSEEEFAALAEQGGYPEFKDMPDPYFEYLMWHEQSKTVMYRYLVYDIETGETSTFASGEMDNYYNEDGEAYWRASGYAFLGFYENRIIFSMNEYDMPGWKMNRWEVYGYDPRTGAREHIFDVAGGNVFDMDNGSVMAGGYIRYCRYTENDTMLVYRYSLATGETEELFEDVWNITFRVAGETTDYFIGCKLVDEDNSILYIITKDAYYTGDFDSAVRLWK